MRVSRTISIYRAQRSQQGCSLSLGMLRLAEPPTGRARLRSSLKSPRNPITPFETSRVSTLHPELYTRFREGARRVIGATAKPLYPIDGKAIGLDRRPPQTSLIEGGGPPAGGGRSYQAVEGVSAGGRMSRPSGAPIHERLRSLNPPPPLFWWFISFSAYMRWSARMRISAAAALSSG